MLFSKFSIFDVLQNARQRVGQAVEALDPNYLLNNRLLAHTERKSLRGKRNYAMLAMLIGCGLRRGELLALCAESFQLR